MPSAVHFCGNIVKSDFEGESVGALLNKREFFAQGMEKNTFHRNLYKSQQKSYNNIR